jgi:hypothetical protein
MMPLDHDGPDRPFRPFPAGDIERPAATLFLEAATRDPHRLAIDDGALPLTYDAMTAPTMLPISEVAEA